MEHHPRLDRRNLQLAQSKIILGSFPIWSLTKHRGNADIIDTKPEILKNGGEFPFFYGSSTNLFWKWYQLYIDPEIILLNVTGIQTSLQRNQIGITDVILSCKRKGKSSLDKDLSQRSYNHEFFSYPKNNEVIKILCTSKGVMNEMLLSNKFFSRHQSLSTDPYRSALIQNEFLKKINGNVQEVTKPIFIEMKVDNGGIIQCLSLPSPGSPYRRLKDFGVGSQILDTYLDSYLSEAFHWFKT